MTYLAYTFLALAVVLSVTGPLYLAWDEYREWQGRRRAMSAERRSDALGRADGTEKKG